MKSDMLEEPAGAGWSPNMDSSRDHTRHNLMRFVRTFFSYLLLSVVSFVFMIPLLWMITTALKPLPDIFKMPPVWLPNPPQWSNMWQPWIDRGFTTYFLNTVKIATLSVVGAILSSSLVAYSLRACAGLAAMHFSSSRSAP